MICNAVSARFVGSPSQSFWIVGTSAEYFGANIHQHCGHKILLCALPSIVRRVSQKANGFVKGALVAADVFVHILEIRQIHMLESLLQGVLSLLWSLAYKK